MPSSDNTNVDRLLGLHRDRADSQGRMDPRSAAPEVSDSRRFTRRQLLQGMGVLAGGTLLATPLAIRHRAAAASTSEPLHIRIRAEKTTATIRTGVSTAVWSYRAQVLAGDPKAVVPSSSYLGPTLRFRRGQRVRVTFENRLPQHSIIHWHGLDLPQRQDGQPADAVDPGSTYEYDFVVTNPPGTYWYHPHPHMHTGEQVYRGLAGLIHVIGDDPASMPTDELDLVLQDRTLASDGSLVYASSMHDNMMGFVGDTNVTNGVINFSTPVRRSPYRLRILNGSNSQTRRLTLSNGARFVVLATDGHLLERPVTTPQLVLTPAQRADVWVDFAGISDKGRLELRSANLFTTGEPLGDLDAKASTVATFVATGAAKPGRVPTSLAAAGSVKLSSPTNASRPKQFVLSTRRMAHWINDTVWNERNVTSNETVKAGTVELWEFVNRSPMPHPMHIHGLPFQVRKRIWESDGLATEWKRIEGGVVETGLVDTVLVWPGQRVEIAVPFTKHRGYYLYHCHVLEHEDAGMMRSFRVV